jgi:hypothetical protein
VVVLLLRWEEFLASEVPKLALEADKNWVCGWLVLV